MSEENGPDTDEDLPTDEFADEDTVVDPGSRPAESSDTLEGVDVAKETT